ncbi:MAG: class I SAM-dependent methyltransferase [Phycisphaeraceae bacterium]|nr:class I SAM-dependent methyltransferase [Phycisphaeraceae bacterium]
MTVSAPLAPARPARLSLRARLLVALEPLFPPVAAPATSSEQSAYEYAKAQGSFADAVAELGSLAGKTVLDFGCGWGGETAWLAERCAFAHGCDVDPNSLAQAEQFRRHRNIHNMAVAPVRNDRLPFADDTFDAVLSTNVFEHVMNPVAMLSEIRRVLKPGGSFITRFGPLFYSPLGYHLCWATQVPWAHLWLGLNPIIEVRNQRRSPIHPTSWEDTGLNRITFARFESAVLTAGLRPRRLRRIPVRRLGPLTHVPLLRDLVTFGIDAHLTKPADRA